MVARMTQLKIKEDPTLADGDKKKDDDKKRINPTRQWRRWNLKRRLRILGGN